jgi:hypothetical protein
MWCTTREHTIAGCCFDLFFLSLEISCDKKWLMLQRPDSHEVCAGPLPVGLALLLQCLLRLLSNCIMSTVLHLSHLQVYCGSPVN